MVRQHGISTHALREEGDQIGECHLIQRVEFLPTPSARRATRHLAPCSGILPISTHALREEGDSRAACSFMPALVFLPTPSARRATVATDYIEESDTDFYPRPPRGGRHDFL